MINKKVAVEKDTMAGVNPKTVKLYLEIGALRQKIDLLYSKIKKIEEREK